MNENPQAAGEDLPPECKNCPECRKRRSWEQMYALVAEINAQPPS